MTFGICHFHFLSTEVQKGNKFVWGRNTVGFVNLNTVGGLLGLVIVMNSCNRNICK